MISILEKLNPNNVYIICRTGGQYPDDYKNQSTENLLLEEYEKKTFVFDEMLGTNKLKI